MAGPATAATEPRPRTVARIGLVVHPKRDLARALETIQGWGDANGVETVQAAEGGRQRRVADFEPAASCDVIVAVGGDGTVLAAIRAAADAGKPVLGVSCGSLGALATVDPNAVSGALDRFAAGDWTPLTLPALAITQDQGAGRVAFNDLVVVRGGAGQISGSAEIDGVVYGRFAGDGAVVSTPLGSSGYGMAAGGPVLAPDADVYSFTLLAAHGGCIPPLVLAAGSVLRLTVDPGHGGARTEIDGQIVETDGFTFDLDLRPGAVAVVRFGDEEPVVTGLRRRGIIADSPRVLARDARLERHRVTDPPVPEA